MIEFSIKDYLNINSRISILLGYNCETSLLMTAQPSGTQTKSIKQLRTAQSNQGIVQCFYEVSYNFDTLQITQVVRLPGN